MSTFAFQQNAKQKPACLLNLRILSDSGREISSQSAEHRTFPKHIIQFIFSHLLHTFCAKRGNIHVFYETECSRCTILGKTRLGFSFFFPFFRFSDLSSRRLTRNWDSRRSNSCYLYSKPKTALEKNKNSDAVCSSRGSISNENIIMSSDTMAMNLITELHQRKSSLAESSPRSQLPGEEKQISSIFRATLLLRRAACSKTNTISPTQIPSSFINRPSFFSPIASLSMKVKAQQIPHCLQFSSES